MAKIVIGNARKTEDIRRIYEMAQSRVSSRGRFTEQGKEYTAFLGEIFDGLDINEVPFQVAVEYVKEASEGQYDDSKKLASSMRAFLNSNAAKTNFRTYLDGKTLMVERVRDN